MKTLIKRLSAATLLATLLLGFSNVHASDTEMTVNKYTETSLSLEKWMTDERLWNDISFVQANLVLEAESPLELESWMFSDNFQGMSMNIENEVEEELTLENWMIDSNVWR